MFGRRISIVVLVLLALVLSTAMVSAEKPPEPGPPDNPGGSPEGEMLDVAGCAYFDEVLGVWRLRAKDPNATGCLPENAETDYKIDFGPEGYCPDPCLTGELITDELNGTEPVDIRIGKNFVGTFKYAEDEYTILAATDPAGPAYKSGIEWIPLTPAEGTNYGRPIEGKWTRVYGRAGETDYAVLVWEIRYNWLPNEYGNWYWWRSTGQPWAKMWLLDCTPPSEGEE